MILGPTKATVLKRHWPRVMGSVLGRFESRSSHRNLPSRDCRCLELIHRTLDVCVRHGLVPEVQRQRLFRPDRPDGNGGKCVAFPGKGAHKKRFGRRKIRMCGRLFRIIASPIGTWGVEMSGSVFLRRTSQIVEWPKRRPDPPRSDPGYDVTIQWKTIFNSHEKR